MKYPEGAPIRIRFQPRGAQEEVAPGTSILSAALWARIPLASTCGGFGSCGECRVQILEGDAPVTEGDRDHLTPEELEAGWRLACSAVPLNDVVCRVPEIHRHPRAAVEGMARPVQLEPLVRVEEEDGVTRVVRGDRELHRQDGPLRRGPLGVALDLGTTTVAGALVDLTRGRILSRAAGVNAQVGLGADVIARAAYAHGGPAHLQELQEMALETLNGILSDLTQEAGADPEDIFEAVVTGNAIMLHLLLGVDPHALAVSPFQAEFSGSQDVAAADLRIPLSWNSGPGKGSKAPIPSLRIHPRGRVVTFPFISSYAGGDLVAALLATELADRREPTLLVDIGTNTEVAVGWGGRVVTAAAPAGPAFEGSGIRFGLPATQGAVAHLRMGDDTPVMELDVIGGEEARGLCGSGLVDTLGELRRTGLLDATGHLASREDVPGHPHGWRLQRRTGKRVFQVTENVHLEQGDVRVLQTAVAAIASAIRLVLEHAGLSESDLGGVYLAGSFGTSLDPATARWAGLVPRVPVEKIRSVGNAALEGARIALFSFRERERAFQIPGHAEYVELSGHPGFNDAFMEAMTFPEVR